MCVPVRVPYSVFPVETAQAEPPSDALRGADAGGGQAEGEFCCHGYAVCIVLCM